MANLYVNNPFTGQKDAVGSGQILTSSGEPTFTPSAYPGFTQLCIDVLTSTMYYYFNGAWNPVAGSGGILDFVWYGDLSTVLYGDGTEVIYGG